MNSLSLSRFGLSVCVVAILFAGCGGSQTPIGTPGVDATMPGFVRTTPARGGAFSGGYSGSATYQQCQPQRQSGGITFKGAGTVSFLGPSTESGELGESFLHGQCGAGWRGRVVLRSSKRPKRDRIDMELSGEYSQLSYTVIRGFGKFSNATGSGTYTFHGQGPISGSAPYSDQWSGTLNF